MTHVAASATVFTVVVDSAIRALALSGAAGLGLVAFRVKTTTVRLFTWTAVLYAALAIPMLKWMLPTVPVLTPQFFQTVTSHSDNSAIERESTRASLPGQISRPTMHPPERDRQAGMLNHAPVVTSADSSGFAGIVRWSTVVTAIYLLGAFWLLARFLVGLQFSSRLLAASCEIDDPRMTRRLSDRANSAGLASAPRAVESELISVPLTVGVVRSTILLPTGWRAWDDAKLDAVVSHEVSHVARYDALTQRVSLLHRAIFWFSPLAWWLDNHLADLAEQASDEAALSSGADRKDYARTLLGFFEALQGAPGRVWWQGVSMAKAGQAEKRLERILTWKGSVTMRLKRSIAVVVITLALPVVYFSASVSATNRAADPRSADTAQDKISPPSRPTPPASEATPPPATGPSSGVIGGVISGVPSRPPSPPAPATGVATSDIAPVEPESPEAPVASTPPPGGQSKKSSSYGHGFSYAYGFDDEQRFVIVSGKSDSFTMSGTSEDARHVEKLKKQMPGDFIWFQRDEKSYIIRDQASIDRARKLWAPQEELGKKQEALGKQQEELGKQQETLGARMEQIHVNVPDMTAEIDKLKAELKQLNSSATVEQVGHIQSEIGELQSKIGELQSQAGDRQGKLGEQMGALGEKQGKLGEEQGELGRRQAKLAEEASRQMKQLLDEAIAKGLAQPEL